MSTNNLILDRLQRLMCLGLEGQPAAELIAGTARVWQEKLARFDARRLVVAFDKIETTTTRWPTPAQVIAALPVYEHTYVPPPVVPPSAQIEPDPEYAARAAARVEKILDACAAHLGVLLPRGK